MVCRLIEHQHIHARIDQLRQRQSSLLATGQIADVLVNVVAGEKKLREKRSQLAGGRARRRHATQLHDDLVAIVQIIELLRVVANLDFCAPTNLTGERWNLVQNRLEKSRLAGSVWTNDSETLTTPQNERDVARQQLVRITDGSFVNRQHVICRCAQSPASENRPTIWSCANSVDAFEFLQHRSARLCLLGFLSREVAANKLFRLGDQLLLIVVSTLLRLASFLALNQVSRNSCRCNSRRDRSRAR